MTTFDELSIATQVSTIRLNAAMLRTIMREAWAEGGIDFPAHSSVVELLHSIEAECDIIDSKLTAR